jgi:hypothetical protein
MREIVIAFIEGVPFHQVRDFGEVLYRAFREDKWASISLDDADCAIDELRVFVRSKRRVRRTMGMIEKLLDQHLLGNRARVFMPPAAGD